MSKHTLKKAWFQLSGLPYPIEGYYDPDAPKTAYVVPGFEIDMAETIVELINRDSDSVDPVLAFDVHDDIIATEEGIEDEYFDILKSKISDDLTLYWMGNGWGWWIVDAPDESKWHLEFRTREQPGTTAYGSGDTLIQALADIERLLIKEFGKEAAFHLHHCFLTRDIVDMPEELAEIGGMSSCYDFSSPEEAFDLRRIPIRPKFAPDPIPRR